MSIKIPEETDKMCERDKFLPFHRDRVPRHARHSNRGLDQVLTGATVPLSDRSRLLQHCQVQMLC